MLLARVRGEMEELALREVRAAGRSASTRDRSSRRGSRPAVRSRTSPAFQSRPLSWSASAVRASSARPSISARRLLPETGCGGSMPEVVEDRREEIDRAHELGHDRARSHAGHAHDQRHADLLLVEEAVREPAVVASGPGRGRHDEDERVVPLAARAAHRTGARPASPRRRPPRRRARPPAPVSCATPFGSIVAAGASRGRADPSSGPRGRTAVLTPARSFVARSGGLVRAALEGRHVPAEVARSASEASACRSSNTWKPRSKPKKRETGKALCTASVRKPVLGEDARRAVVAASAKAESAAGVEHAQSVLAGCRARSGWRRARRASPRPC